MKKLITTAALIAASFTASANVYNADGITVAHEGKLVVLRAKFSENNLGLTQYAMSCSVQSKDDFTGQTFITVKDYVFHDPKKALINTGQVNQIHMKGNDPKSRIKRGAANVKSFNAKSGWFSMAEVKHDITTNPHYRILIGNHQNVFLNNTKTQFTVNRSKDTAVLNHTGFDAAFKVFDAECKKF